MEVIGWVLLFFFAGGFLGGLSWAEARVLPLVLSCALVLETLAVVLLLHQRADLRRNINRMSAGWASEVRRRMQPRPRPRSEWRGPFPMPPAGGVSR